MTNSSIGSDIALYIEEILKISPESDKFFSQEFNWNELKYEPNVISDEHGIVATMLIKQIQLNYTMMPISRQKIAQKYFGDYKRIRTKEAFIERLDSLFINNNYDFYEIYDTIVYLLAFFHMNNGFTRKSKLGTLYKIISLAQFFIEIVPLCNFIENLQEKTGENHNTSITNSKNGKLALMHKINNEQHSFFSKDFITHIYNNNTTFADAFTILDKEVKMNSEYYLEHLKKIDTESYEAYFYIKGNFNILLFYPTYITSNLTLTNDDIKKYREYDDFLINHYEQIVYHNQHLSQQEFYEYDKRIEFARFHQNLRPAEDSDIIKMLLEQGSSGFIWQTYYHDWISDYNKRLFFWNREERGPQSIAKDTDYEILYLSYQRTLTSEVNRDMNKLKQEASSPLFQSLANILQLLRYIPNNKYFSIDHYTNSNALHKLLIEKSIFRLNSALMMNDDAEGKILNNLLNINNSEVNDIIPLIACFSLRHIDFNQLRLYSSDTNSNTKITGGIIHFNPSFNIQKNFLEVFLEGQPHYYQYRCIYIDSLLASKKLDFVVSVAHYDEYSLRKHANTMFDNITSEIIEKELTIENISSHLINITAPYVKFKNDEEKIQISNNIMLLIEQKVSDSAEKQIKKSDAYKIMHLVLQKITMPLILQSAFENQLLLVKQIQSEFDIILDLWDEKTASLVEKSMIKLLSYLIKPANFKDEEELRLLNFHPLSSNALKINELTGNLYEDYQLTSNLMDYIDKIILGKEFNNKELFAVKVRNAWSDSHKEIHIEDTDGNRY